MTSRLVRSARHFLGAACLLGAGLAWSQPFPNKLVSLVVPFPAGGAADAGARTMQPILQKQFGQPVIIDNIAGASGAIGVQRLLSDPADGYRILVGSPSETIVTPLAMSAARYAGNDLRFVGAFGINHMVLVTRPGLPVSSVDELVALARNPANKQLSYASVGHGSLFHVVTADFLHRTGTTMLHVPYKGMAPILADMLGDVVDVAMLPLGGNIPDMIRTGKLKALGVTSAARATQLPAVPAIGESKVLSGFEYSYWTGLLVRKDTPDAVVDRINLALATVLQDPTFRKFVEDSGATVAAPASADKANALYQADVARYLALARSIALKPE